MVDIKELQSITKQDLGASALEYTFECRLNPKALTSLKKPQMHWKSIKYRTGNKSAIPNNQPGIYAFAIKHTNNTLPENCYILYIGIAGAKNNNRSLRDRYNDYLSTSKIKGRSNVCRMISTWHSVLHFFFAPVANLNDRIALEKEMNDALRPFFSIQDYSARVRRARSAFP